MESNRDSEQPQKETTEKEVGQRVCPNCGEKLREGASFCVGCGMPIQQNVESIPKQDVQSDDSKSNATIGSTQETNRSNPPQESYVIREQPQKNKTLKVFIRALTAVIASIALLYVCLAGYALFKSLFSTSKGEEASLVEAKNYISPDLKLFDLQGDVKECWQSSSLGIMDELTLSFDTKGKLTSIKNRRSYRDDIEGDGVYYGLARDNEGRIVQFHQVGVFDLGDEINIRYNEDGVIAKVNGIYIIDPFEITYNYENGKLMNAITEAYYEDGDHLKITYTFAFENMDKYGNWLTCKRYSKISSYNEDTGKIYEESQDEMTITRKITYYSQSSDEQNSIDTEYESSIKQKDTDAKSDMESFYRMNFPQIKELLGEYRIKNKTQYALKDLDGDGNDEFFITDADIWHTSVFTVENGDIKAVTSSEGLINSVFGQLLIYGVPGSSWGCVVYCLFADGDIIKGETGTTMDGDKFYLNDKECSKEEFEQFFSQYKGKEEFLEWKPLSSLIGDTE